jgi:RNA polymerase sigma factor (TIGR02999 family)
VAIHALGTNGRITLCVGLLRLVSREPRTDVASHRAGERGHLRRVDVARVRWQDRTHFFAVAAQARGRQKRGGEAIRVALDESIDSAPMRATELIALDLALHSLASFDPRKAQVVELRFFGGLSVGEAAEVLKVSPQTVLRDWKLARAWLTEELANPAA